MKASIPSAATLLAALIFASIHPAQAHEGQGDDHGVTPYGHPGTAQHVTQTLNLTMSDQMKFNPDHLDIKLGQTVRLHIRNGGQIAHEFVMGTREDLREHAEMMKQMPNMQHSDASSIRVAPGQTGDIVWTFDKPGDFWFACLIPGHFESGMEGTIHVGPRTAGPSHEAHP